MAREHPEATWMVTEQDGDWALVKVGLKPNDPASQGAVETRPKPPQADDPRTIHDQTIGPWVGPGV